MYTSNIHGCFQSDRSQKTAQIVQLPYGEGRQIFNSMKKLKKYDSLRRIAFRFRNRSPSTEIHFHCTLSLMLRLSIKTEIPTLPSWNRPYIQYGYVFLGDKSTVSKIADVH